MIQITSPRIVTGLYNLWCSFGSEDTYMVEEPFLVYNKSTITYTSISPDSIDINTAVTAIITGSGFVNTSDIACVSQYDRVFEAEFVSSTRVSCSIPATRNSVRLALGVSFSRGDRKVVRNGLNFTIYANASHPSNARFLNTLQGIEVNFDVPTKPKISSVACSTFFPANNVSLLGSMAECRFLTQRKMVIKLRGRPTILPRQTLTFKLRSVVQVKQLVTKEPQMYQDLLVRSPKQRVVPKARVTGTSVLGEYALLFMIVETHVVYVLSCRTCKDFPL